MKNQTAQKPGIERNILRNGNKLYLCKKGSPGSKRQFTIQKNLSQQGSSVICYKASYDDSGVSINGILKEFYPKDAYGLERDTCGQLIPNAEFGEQLGSFRREEKAFVKPYEDLKSAREKNEALKDFFPDFTNVRLITRPVESVISLLKPSM